MPVALHGSATTRILVVATVRLYRECLAVALSNRPGIAVVGTAAEGMGARRLVATTDTAVAVVDVGLLRRTDLGAQLREARLGIKVIALGVRDDAPQILACAEVGVASYVLREAGVGELVEVLREIERGELRCTPAVAAMLMRRVSELAGVLQAGEPTSNELTVREREILALVEQGLMNKEIARRIGLSLFTVKNHVHNVLEKLNLNSRNDAARWHRNEAALQSLALV